MSEGKSDCFQVSDIIFGPRNTIQKGQLVISLQRSIEVGTASTVMSYSVRRTAGVHGVR